MIFFFFFFFQAEDGIRDFHVTGVQTCALPISPPQLPPPTVSQPQRQPTVPRVSGPRPDGETISIRSLSKHYGAKVAVDELSFDVLPGRVTGFLGPNGAGKSTTMRVIMGLDAPTAGTATVNGRRYHDLSWPLREVGALLEAR